MTDPNYQSHKITFSNPLNGRKWLKLLEPSIEFGLKFKPLLSLKTRKEIGFTFRTNELGFHGNNIPEADNVILGTSFGMGLGVDEGANWFQLDDHLKNNYFNLAMPVSPHNHLNALQAYYKGKGKVLIYVYHPNVWKTAASFYKSEKHSKNIFEFLNWSVDYISIFKLMPKWLLKKLYFKLYGIEQSYKDKDSRVYTVNAKYNYYSLKSKENKVLFDKAMDGLNQIFDKFEKVYVFRVPIKEQLINKKINNKNLQKLCDNYDECWDEFMSALSIETKDSISILDLVRIDYFQLSDFLPNDTHWSPQGNKNFCSFLSMKVKCI